MQGYTLKQCGSKSWTAVYSVIHNGVLVLAEDKESYIAGNYQKEISLSDISVYIGDVLDKKMSHVFYIRMHCHVKRVLISLGYRYEESRNTWLYTILTIFAKKFVSRNERPHSSSCNTENVSTSRLLPLKQRSFSLEMFPPINLALFTPVFNSQHTEQL